MTTQSDCLETLAVDMAIKVSKELDRDVFIFAGGHLVGKLIEIKLVQAVASPTYRKNVTDDTIERCVQLLYIPGPRNKSKVVDPLAFSFTRKPSTFFIPTRALSKGFFLRKLDPQVWIINVVSDFKGEIDTETV